MEVVVPDLGDFDDVEVIEVLVKPGDTVVEETPLITLETDKASMDVPSPAAGEVRELKVSVGDHISAGDVILLLSAEEPAEPSVAAASDGGAAADGPTADAVAAEAPAAETPAVEAPPPRPARASPPRRPGAVTAIDEASFSRAHASPSVRKLARELGVDLGRVHGSGRKGRITAEDLKAYVKEMLQGGGAALPAVPDVDFAKFGEIEMVPLSRIQRISGPRLHASWVNVPHVTQHDEADITELEQTRQSLKAQAAERGIRLTPLAFIIRACVLTLDEMPRFKASLSPDGANLVMKHYTHIGFAADTPNGLVVPVIRNAERMDIYELAKQLGELSERARAGKLSVDQLQGGVFTVSSLGSIGGTFFTPIINAPEVAILGVSRSRWAPQYVDETFVPRLMLPLSLSYDHRVIDGATAVRFTTRLAETLADVERLLEAIP